MIRKLAFVLAAALVVGGGCVAPDLLNLATGAGKLLSNPTDPPIGDLTGAEIFAMSNHLGEIAAQFPALGLTQEQIASVPKLTQQQADDLAAFMDTNDIQAVGDLQKLATQATVVIPDSLKELMASLGYVVP
jgi:cytochrome c